MVVRFTVFETRGGRIIEEVEPSQFDWQEQSNRAETVSMTFVDDVPAWRNLFTPWKHSIAVEIGTKAFGGPILPGDLDGDGLGLKLTARGYRRMLEGVPVLPVAALSRVDSLAPGGVPDTALDTVLTGDLGTRGKKVIAQLLEWPGWQDSPITLPPDRPGAGGETIPAVDRKSIDSFLSDLSGRDGGPDIRIRLVRTDPDHFGWVYEAGTAEQPRLQGDVPLVWEPKDVTGLGVQMDATKMGSIAWSSGGRSSDQTLIRWAYDPYLVDRGFPLLHLDSDMSSSASDPATFDSWNAETLRTARMPWEFWQFKVPADESPYPHEYGCGSLAEVILRDDIRIRAGLLSGPMTLSGPGVLSGSFATETLGDYFPAGSYTRRIVGLAGSSDTDLITVTCGPAYGGSNG